MIFKKGNMLVLQNENNEKICLYPEFLTTSLSFSSDSRKNVTVNINKSDKKNYLYFKKFIYDAKKAKKSFINNLSNSVTFDSDVEIKKFSNKLLIEEFNDNIIIKLIYNTKGSFNSVKVLSPYFNGKTDLETYVILCNLYYDIINQKKLEVVQKNKVKKYSLK